MTNTVISIKKSNTPDAVPTDLALGELALNYADGKLFYKRANGLITYISTAAADSFGTINANGTLIISDAMADVLTIEPGNGIAIVGDALNDKIIISTTANAEASFDIAIAAFNKANSTTYTSNLVISVADDSNAALRITQTGTAAAIRIEDSSDPDSTPFIVDANGSVGIGIAEPTSNLHVIGTANISSSLLLNSVNVGATLNSAFGQANTALSVGQAAFGQANTALTTGQAAFGQANTANITADLAFGQANTANITADLAFGQANTALTTGQTAFSQANTALSVGQTAFGQANAAYDFANTRFASTGGTITGNVNIVGNLTLSGNTYLINVSSYSVQDPLIYLASNNYTSDIVDIGFIANYVNATGQNVHTGVFRDHTTKEYYVFEEYNEEPINNHIDPTANGFTVSVLNATLRTSNIILGGVNALSWIRSSYNQANDAFNQANAAYDRANTALTTGQAAFGQANTALSVGQAAFGQANTANITADLAFGQANIAFASSNSVNAYSNSTYVKLTSSSQTITGNINVAGSLTISENLTVSAIVANGTLGTEGQFLTSNGNTVYWSTTTSGTAIFTSNLGNTSANTFNVAHNLNNLFVIPAVREYSSGYYVYPDIKTTTPNHVVIEFVNAPSTNQYAILVVG